GQETLRDLFQPFGSSEALGNLFQPSARSAGVERLVATWPENRGEPGGVNSPEEEVVVGNRKRPAGPIAGRLGPRPGTFRANPEAHSIKSAYRPAAGCSRMDLHHRRPDPDAGDQILVGDLEMVGIMGNIGGRAAHVEPDQPHAFSRPEMGPACSDHADNT